MKKALEATKDPISRWEDPVELSYYAFKNKQSIFKYFGNIIDMDKANGGWVNSYIPENVIDYYVANGIITDDAKQNIVILTDLGREIKREYINELADEEEYKSKKNKELNKHILKQE